MYVCTLEHLDRLPLDSKVLVNSTVFTKAADGLVDGEGHTIPFTAFEKAATSFNIHTGDDPGWKPGTWLSYHRTWYYVLGVDAASGGYVVAQFGDSGELIGVPIHPYEAIASSSVQAPGFATTVIDWRAVITTALNIYLGVPFLGGAAVVVTPALVDALHVYAADNPTLDPVLHEHGVGRMRKGVVTVSATGLAGVTPEMFGGGVEVGDVQVAWGFTYNYDAVAKMSDPCLCVSFDERLFNTRLPLQVRGNPEWSLWCTEDDCINKDSVSTGVKTLRGTAKVG